MGNFLNKKQHNLSAVKKNRKRLTDILTMGQNNLAKLWANK